MIIDLSTDILHSELPMCIEIVLDKRTLFFLHLKIIELRSVLSKWRKFKIRFSSLYGYLVVQLW